jgi:uncharacterized protein YndB with AHSA1/START domain
MTDDDGTRDAVVIERIFDAPVDVIWRMWTDPGHFREWFGPDGATIPVAKLDVRAGGARQVCMEVSTPNGPVQMWFTGEFREVVENRRLVYSEAVADEAGNVLGHHAMTEITVELEDTGGRTRMVMTHAGVPADSPGAAGWTMAFAKLAAHVARSGAAG